MLPRHALTLIHDYSKPLTRPNWRLGTPLATLISQSFIMLYINKIIKQQLDESDSDKLYALSRVGLEKKFNKIITYTGNYIQQYGEDLLMHTHPYLYNPPDANFYLYAKLYLKNTGNLVLSHSIVQGKCCYVYIYLKN